MHSSLAQAEYAGEIVCGLLGLVARFAGLSPALLGSATLFALTILLVQRLGPAARSSSRPSPRAG